MGRPLTGGDDDDPVHLRMNVAINLDDPSFRKNHFPALALRVITEIEIARSRQGKNIVKNRVEIGKGNLRPGGNDQEVRFKVAVSLIHAGSDWP